MTVEGLLDLTLPREVMELYGAIETLKIRDKYWYVVTE